MTKGLETNHDSIHGLISTILENRLPVRFLAEAQRDIVEAVYDGFPVQDLRVLAQARTLVADEVLAGVVENMGEQFSGISHMCAHLLDSQSHDVRCKAIIAFSKHPSLAGRDIREKIAALVDDNVPSVSAAAKTFIAKIT